jgi:DNA-binding transcriptional LysR family regulator
MEMHQIRYFLAVSEELNFTRAAELCHVTQPALTRAVQKLEEELGGLLFRRERSQTHLTDLGRLMRPHLEQILHEAEHAKTAAKGFLKLERAPLGVGVMCTVGPMRFVSFLGAFRAAHPGVELTLKEGTPDQLHAMLRDGSIDLAVMAQPTPFAEHYDVKPLYRERYVVAFPSGHRFMRQNAIKATDIQGENLLSRTHCEFHDHVSELMRERGIKANVCFGSDREDWIQSMIVAGLGCCLFWESSPTIPGIETRPLIDPEIAREVSLVSIAGRRFSPAVATFVRAIRGFRWGT